MANLILKEANLINNLNFFSKLVGKDRLCAVLKDNAYGHGIDEIAQLISKLGVSHCAVKNENEAKIALKNKFKSILILYPESYDIDDERITYSINDIGILESLDKGINIEVKIDTGMSRNGIKVEEISKDILLYIFTNFSVKGFFSHFASVNDDEYHLIKQKEKFDKFRRVISEQYGIKDDIRFHLCNSDSTIYFHYNKSHDVPYYDMYRIGIGLYGYSYSHVFQKGLLKPIMSLESKRISTRYLSQGERIGYGVHGYKCSRPMIVSNYDLGYGSGFPKIKEREIYYLPNGNKILGAMSMDSFSVEGNEKSIIVADDFVHLAELKSLDYYEILVSFNQNINRKMVFK